MGVVESALDKTPMRTFQGRIAVTRMRASDRRLPRPAQSLDNVKSFTPTQQVKNGLDFRMENLPQIA